VSAALIEYRTGLPDPGEYAALFETTGWNARFEVDEAQLGRALRASWSTVSAYESGRLVGFGRTLSDGVLYAVLFDVIVHPEFQRRGIGREIVKRLVGGCRAAGIRDIQLFSAPGKIRFYERLGFQPRPDEAPGMRLPAAPPPAASGAGSKRG
jgi:ribosomal protein S18 acetylase RimI-like enzyme